MPAEKHSRTNASTSVSGRPPHGSSGEPSALESAFRELELGELRGDRTRQGVAVEADPHHVPALAPYAPPPATSELDVL